MEKNRDVLVLVGVLDQLELLFVIKGCGVEDLAIEDAFLSTFLKSFLRGYWNAFRYYILL